MKDSIVLQEEIPDVGTLVIRYLTLNDAVAMCEYINSLSNEGTFVTFQGEEITLESEESFVKSEMERIEKKQSVMLLAFVNQQLVGISAIDLKDKVSSHEGVLGISINQKYRGKKIGKKFFSCLLEEAKKNLQNLKIITLEVFSINDVAKHMYESFGFQEFGKLPKGIYYKGQYVDHVYMFLEV
jgi:RimJ/RimL family protein N-acetyltransferase